MITLVAVCPASLVSFTTWLVKVAFDPTICGTGTQKVGWMPSSARDPPVALFALPTGSFDPVSTPSCSAGGLAAGSLPASENAAAPPPGPCTELLTRKFVRLGCAEKSRYLGTGAVALGMLTVLTGAKLPDTCIAFKSPEAAFSTSSGNVKVSMTDGSAASTTQVAVT